MIGKTDLEERVREWGLREEIVEKDYVIGWLLWGIGSDETLARTWAFKGGTSLKKCYIETYRFSEDLDFTVLRGGPIRPEDLQPILKTLLERVNAESGVDFSGREPFLKGHPSGNYTQGRIYYRGPRNAPQVARVKLDLSASEQVVQPTVLRLISHPYPDELPGPATVRCYSFEEVFAEKIRAMGERGRPRDLYDIVNLFRRPDMRGESELIRSVLVQKCETKGVPVPTVSGIEASTPLDELGTDWSHMLAHQLPSLPPFEDFWQELPNLFLWLEGALVGEELEAIPLAAEEEPADAWSPPPTVWTWGTGVPLETIRFAASNHLCVTLGYQGKTRMIEPYSLRRTRDGNLILHAIRVDSRAHRSYRVDRIQSVEVTSQVFKPVYRVEFSSSGRIVASPTTTTPQTTTRPRTPRATGRRLSRRPKRHGTVYVIQCSYCQKKFRRKEYSTKLNRHKDKQGYPCAGRIGYLVDTRYE